MGLRQSAVNTLSYQPGRVPKLRRAKRRQKDRNRRLRMSTLRRGPPWAAAGPNGRLNQSRFPADRLGDEAGVGWHLVTTLFSLRLRVAQHFTQRLAADT